jgi:hypothetical protein
MFFNFNLINHYFFYLLTTSDFFLASGTPLAPLALGLFILATPLCDTNELLADFRLLKLETELLFIFLPILSAFTYTLPIISKFLYSTRLILCGDIGLIPTTLLI